MLRGRWGGGVWFESVIRLAPALAGLGTVLVAAAFAADRSTAPATAWLGLAATGVLAPLFLVVRTGRLQLALLSLLAPAAIVLLPREGAAPLAALALLLAAAVALVAIEQDGRPARAGRFTWLAVSFAAQTVLHFDQLWSRPAELATLLELVAAPALAGLLLGNLDRYERGETSTVAAVLFAAGPGFTLVSLAALGLAALVARVRPASARLALLIVALPAFGHEPAWAALALCGFAAAAGLGPSALARAGRGLVGLVALGSLLAAAPPWLRGEPVSEVLGTLARPPFARLELPLVHRSLALSAASPRAEWPLSGAPVGFLVVDSFLTDATALDCGRAVATLRLSAADRPPVVAEIRVGDGAGEWASARPDVAAALACRSMIPFTHWIPAGGRFLGRTFRARLAIDPAYPAERVEIERAPGLPDSVRVHIQRVASER